MGALAEPSPSLSLVQKTTTATRLLILGNMSMEQSTAATAPMPPAETESPSVKQSLTAGRVHGGSHTKYDRTAGSKVKERWRAHRMTEDYVNLVSDLMYPRVAYGPFGYAPQEGRFPVERVTTLGYLLNPMRKVHVAEKWSPFEVSVFEASITLYGKNFNQISKHVKTKSVKEVIEFYYFWKKTSHYRQYKKTLLQDSRDFPQSIEETKKEVEKEAREKERK